MKHPSVRPVACGVGDGRLEKIIESIARRLRCDMTCLFVVVVNMSVELRSYKQQVLRYGCSMGQANVGFRSTPESQIQFKGSLNEIMTPLRVDLAIVLVYILGCTHARPTHRPIGVL